MHGKPLLFLTKVHQCYTIVIYMLFLNTKHKHTCRQLFKKQNSRFVSTPQYCANVLLNSQCSTVVIVFLFQN